MINVLLQKNVTVNILCGLYTIYLNTNISKLRRNIMCMLLITITTSMFFILNVSIYYTLPLYIHDIETFPDIVKSPFSNISGGIGY